MSITLDPTITDETPAIETLLSHWREVTAKGMSAPWAPDRAARILEYISELEAKVESAERRLAEQIAIRMEDRARLKARCTCGYGREVA